MRNIKITIEYDGSRYKGFQRLKDNDNTIQGKIEAVLSKMADEKIEIIGSGRTDMGVHAYNQVANFKT
ncbi:MAG: tRNA pseudouridine(38-40) synthase TruA, partial [Paraclostridium bifermentans]